MIAIVFFLYEQYPVIQKKVDWFVRDPISDGDPIPTAIGVWDTTFPSFKVTKMDIYFSHIDDSALVTIDMDSIDYSMDVYQFKEMVRHHFKHVPLTR